MPDEPRKQPKNQEQMRDRFAACVFGGAIGDAFGAPIEGYSQQTIYKRVGTRAGLYDMPDIGDRSLNEKRPAGRITDDTNMLAMTLIAGGLVSPDNDREDFLHYAWQAYLCWGALQEEAGDVNLAQFFDKHIDWPQIMDSFLKSGGAGRGTIGALAEGVQGTVEHPLKFDRVIRGKRVTGPNKGCGGLMRIAPIAFMVPPEDVFDTAIATAAITHGDPDAYNGAGVVAEWVSNGAQHGALEIFGGGPQDASLRAIFQIAAHEAKKSPLQSAVIEKIPSLIGETNLFSARSVFAQVAYVVASACNKHGTPAHFKAAIRCAANITGDSDSVAAICGNILGAAWGTRAIPQDWLAKVEKSAQLQSLIDWSLPRLYATA